MSYCSWCWGKGHNAASCPERKKHIQENPDSYEAKREAKKLERRKNRKQTTRKCSFCRKPGHTTKTCMLKKTIHQHYRSLTSVYRRKVLEEMCIMGFGVGALVNVHVQSNQEPILAMVKDIKWNRISPASDASMYCVQLERLGPIDEEYFKHWSPARRRSLGSRHLFELLSRPMMGEIYQRDDVYSNFLDNGGCSLELVSSVDSSTIIPPSDFLSGTLSEYANENPLKYENKDRSLSHMEYEFGHLAYYAGVLGMKEIEKYFASFF